MSVREPSAQVLDWELWSQVQRHFDSRETVGGRIGKGNEILITEKDVFNMSPAQLDEYMDWYENSWLDHSKSKERRRNQHLHSVLIFISSLKSVGRLLPNWSDCLAKPAYFFSGR